MIKEVRLFGLKELPSQVVNAKTGNAISFESDKEKMAIYIKNLKIDLTNFKEGIYSHIKLI